MVGFNFWGVLISVLFGFFLYKMTWQRRLKSFHVWMKIRSFVRGVLGRSIQNYPFGYVHMHTYTKLIYVRDEHRNIKTNTTRYLLTVIFVTDVMI
jgi:hypothetical protein